jgi:hypothetical protein
MNQTTRCSNPKVLVPLTLIIMLVGCKEGTTGPGTPAGAANVVFTGWYSIVPDAVGSLETDYGYAKNVGTATAYNVRYVVSGTWNPLNPPTLPPQATASFSIRVGKGTSSSHTPTFTWTETP